MARSARLGPTGLESFIRDARIGTGTSRTKISRADPINVWEFHDFLLSSRTVLDCGIAIGPLYEFISWLLCERAIWIYRIWTLNRSYSYIHFRFFSNSVNCAQESETYKRHWIVCCCIQIQMIGRRHWQLISYAAHTLWPQIIAELFIWHGTPVFRMREK